MVSLFLSCLLALSISSVSALEQTQELQDLVLSPGSALPLSLQPINPKRVPSAIRIRTFHRSRVIPSLGHRRGLESDDVNLNLNANSELLVPEAQSYFIVPETPSTTTVKPIFKRRKTQRPIGSLNENMNRNKNPTSDTNPEQQQAYNPFAQIVNTSFAKKRPSNKPRSRASSREQVENINNGVNYENNEINTTTEGLNNNEQVGSSTGRSKFGRRKRIGGGQPKSNGPNGFGQQPIVPQSQQLKIERPNRFAPQRRSFRTSTVAPVEENAQLAQTVTERQNTRSGRQFILRPKQAAEQSQSVPVSAPVGENRPLRKRKRLTTEASAPLNEGELPTARKVPSEGPSRNNNVFRTTNRRPFMLRPKQLQLASPIDHTINPVENSHAFDPTPLNRRMRHRPTLNSKQLQLSTLDSVHESSDSVPVVVVTSSNGGALVRSPRTSSSTTEGPPAEDNSDSGANGSSTTAPETSGVPYHPRNLSNRKPNPLDKLQNRQTAARRFLTPKPATTPVPAVLTTRIPRKSPLSLSNLRNRRLGGPTTTTTEAPSQPAGEEGASPDALAVNSTNVNGTEAVKSTPEDGDADSKIPKEETEAVKSEPEVEKPKSPLAGLLKRPPRLPGQGVNSKQRTPLIKPKPTTEATTQKPVSVETTTIPTCDEGKRYNKILRKCIPSFSQRTG